MSDLRTAAQQALEAWFQPNGINYVDFKPYMEALRAALAQQEQDTGCRTCGGKGCVACDARHPVNQELLGAMKDFGGSDD